MNLISIATVSWNRLKLAKNSNGVCVVAYHATNERPRVSQLVECDGAKSLHLCSVRVRSRFFAFVSLQLHNCE